MTAVTTRGFPVFLRRDPGYQKALPAEVCGVDAGLAGEIAEDVRQRAEVFTALPDRAQDVLIASFVEEVFDHRPAEAPLDLNAQVTVVRNSGRGSPGPRPG